MPRLVMDVYALKNIYYSCKNHNFKLVLRTITNIELTSLRRNCTNKVLYEPGGT